MNSIVAIAPIGCPILFTLFIKVISASFSSTIFFTIARPRPVPLDLVVMYGSNTLGKRSSLIPEPLSSIESLTLLVEFNLTKLHTILISPSGLFSMASCAF